MNMSAKTDFLSEVANVESIPIQKLAYLEQRAVNTIYSYVSGKFQREHDSNGLTKADLARRIQKSPAQINRWLATPSNWTLGTLALLLLGISGEEPHISSTKYSNRTPQNHDMESYFDSIMNPVPPSKSSGPTLRAAIITGNQQDNSRPFSPVNITTVQQ